MASSTTSVASSSQQGNLWKNDVFLSFGGEDIRKDFGPHLYRELTSAGITIYNDYLLEIEIPIKEQILKAISESRISVVVLSPNYASSSWCLDELVGIMECRETKGQKVVPIFCGVDPFEVKWLTGKYGKALERHRERFLEDTVVMWEKALSEVGKLPGWILQDWEEAMVIEHAVGHISDELLILSLRDKCLPSLRELDLRHSNMIRIPDLSEVEALERMYLSNCKNLIDVSSIQYLKKLEHLDLEGCTSLQELPNTEGCVNLTILILSGCSHLMELPKLSRSIKYLYLEGLPIKELHPLCLPSLRELDLRHSNIIRIPDLSEAEALERIYLSNCENLIDISSIQYLKKLEHLDLEGCTSLQELPDTEGCVSLTTLILSGCSYLMELPKLSSSIKYLYLEGLPIKELHPSAKALSNLVELDVRNCGRLWQIHVDLFKLTSLEKFRLAGSRKLLRHLGDDGIPQRSNLEVECGTLNYMDYIWDMVSVDWMLLYATLIIEAASSAFEQLQYPLMGMIMAILGLLLCAMDLKFKAWKEQATWQWRGSIPWIYGHHPHDKPFGTMIEYFGLVAAIWQVLHSTVGYIFAFQKLENPIRMTLFMFIFCLGLLVGKLIELIKKYQRHAHQPSHLRSIVVEI